MKPIITLALICAFGLCKAQTPVDVADNTFKVKGIDEQVFYYGFAAGDQLLFSFTEVDGKELKEVEIIEMPGSSKFMDYKSKKVEGKTLHVTNDAIYKFRFANANVAGRVCKVKIQRIPASSATANFNTNVLWRTINDTTYTQEQERYLAKSDTSHINILNANPKLSSDKFGTSEHSSDYAAFQVPEHTISLSYYLGVDEGNSNAYAGALDGVTKDFGPKVVMLDPEAAVALYGLKYLNAAGGENAVDFSIVDAENEALWAAGSTDYKVYKSGTRIREAGQLLNPVPGNYYFLLKNRNNVSALQVMLSASALVVKNTWAERPVFKMHVEQRQQAYLAK